MTEGLIISVRGMRKSISAAVTVSPLVLQTVLGETAGFVLEQTDLKTLSIPKRLM